MIQLLPYIFPKQKKNVGKEWLWKDGYIKKRKELYDFT